MTVSSGVVKVADWTDQRGFVMENKYSDASQPHTEYERNRTYVITTVLERPYMWRKAKSYDDGNNSYEGFSRDLADLIARKLGINCKQRRINCLIWCKIVDCSQTFYASPKTIKSARRTRAPWAAGTASSANSYGMYA